jgi:hypothetical protein
MRGSRCTVQYAVADDSWMGKRRRRQSAIADCKQRLSTLYSLAGIFAFCLPFHIVPRYLPVCESFFVNVKRSSGARSARPVFPALRGDDRCCRRLFSAACAEPSAPTDHRKSSSAPFGVFGSDRRTSSGNERHAALQTLACCLRCLREDHVRPPMQFTSEDRPHRTSPRHQVPAL